MFMSGTGNGGYGHGQGPGSNGSCNPRKFSEKIALLTQRQAEDTAAFQEVMMDITSTRVLVQRARQARSQGLYYGGSLPNVNQIGRNPSDFQCHSQGPPSCGPDSGCPTRRRPMADPGQSDGQLSFPVRSVRRHMDSAPYRPVHLSPPAEPCWKRSWAESTQMDTSKHIQPSMTALNRTNSDSALHTSVRNTHTGDLLSPTQRTRHRMFPYPVPPIEENVLEEGKLSHSSRKSAVEHNKACELPGIKILSSPDQQLGSLLDLPAALSASGSLPDLSSLHLPSPHPGGASLDSDSLPGSLSMACSTGHLPGTTSDLKDLVAREDQFHLPGLCVSLQGSISNPLLPSSLSHPNIQSSLSSHSLPCSLNSASLHLSLSNPSLQSSPSNQSLQSFLSNSSLSGQSIQSAASHCSYSSGIGGSRSCSSSSLSASPRPTGQSVSRRRTPLSPLVVPPGGETRWHQTKQFSPVGSPTLSSITQGVLLDTSSQVPKEQNPNQGSQPTHPPAQGPILPQQQLSVSEAQQQQTCLELQPQTAQHQDKLRPGHCPQQPHQLPQKQNIQSQKHYYQHHQQDQQQHHRQHQQHIQEHQQRQTQVYPYLYPHIQTDRQDLSSQQQLSQHHQRLYLQQHQQAHTHSYQHFQHPHPTPNQHPHPHSQPHPQPLPHQHQPHSHPHPHQTQPQSVRLQPQQIQHGGQLPQQQHSDQHQWGNQRPYLPFQGADLQKVPNGEVGRRQNQGMGWGQQRRPPQTLEAASQSPSSLDHLQKGYMGLHLTPSQTEALSQQLVQLRKEPPWSELPGMDQNHSSTEFQNHNSTEFQNHIRTGFQNHSSTEFQNMPMTVYNDLDTLPILGFDDDPFSLDDPLQIDPLDLEELHMLGGDKGVEEASLCSTLLR
ncbi:CREB-regulated transcription coactivator 2-like isoform X1 [Osmerus eperlanus]|uniref:CREB-regulated transcription coactivator 2-like isoform X1 n=1 Tax=Osmerus eperlanus TaxID=29151 RepID=UPI002E1485B9